MKRYLVAFCLISFFYIDFLCAKTAVFIIGFPRSGSSCLTGTLEILGLNLDHENLHVGVGRFKDLNPKGYFEHTPLMNLNNKLLHELGTSIYDGRIIKLSNLPVETQRIMIDEIKATIDQHFHDADLFGFKDVRTTILLPLYVIAAHELGYEVKVIGTKRATSEVVSSMKRFAEVAENLTQTLVRKFTLLMEVYREVYDYTTVSYDDFLNNTEQVLSSLNNFIPQLIPYEQKLDEIEIFIDRKLRHFST